MSDELNEPLRVPPDIRSSLDSCTHISISREIIYATYNTPQKRTSNKRCGSCESYNTELIYLFQGQLGQRQFGRRNITA